MRLTLRQQEILLGILSDLEHFAALAPQFRGDHHERITLANERQRIADAFNGLVVTRPAIWLGEPMTASAYVQVGRDYKTLERRGLIDRHALGDSPQRTTHLSLTDAGRLHADQLRRETVADG